MAARLEDVGAVADELYTVDPNDFVAARTDLVRRLRAAKQRDVAASVAKLRRPTPAAWAVNQLVRTQRGEVEDLVRLGEELRSAQERALGGAGGDELRHAARARRDAVAALTAGAARLLATRGGGVDAHLPGVAATLEAASLDADLGTTVLEGRLSTELEPPSGFGQLPFDVALPQAPAPAPEAPTVQEPAPEPPERRREVEAAERVVADARRHAEELAAAARAAAAAAGERRRAVEEAEADVDRLRTQLADAEHRLAVAGDEAATAAREALDADAAAARAADALDQADRRLRDAEA